MKIVNDPARLPKSSRRVAACFDVLTAEHVRRLRALRREGEALVIVLRDPPDPLLDRRARAELAASLADVDWVLDADVEADVTLEEDREGLIRHVLDRY